MKNLKEKIHYSRSEKAALLVRCMPEEDAIELANILDRFTFAMLCGLAQQITLFAKGKKA